MRGGWLSFSVGAVFAAALAALPLAAAADAETITIPAGTSAKLVGAHFGGYDNCPVDSLTYGYQLGGGAKVTVASGTGCEDVAGATIGPVKTETTLRIWLTDHHRPESTFYSDGNHALLSGSDPYELPFEVAIMDDFDGAAGTSVERLPEGPGGGNLNVTIEVEPSYRPTVLAAPASLITPSSATLNATVDPNGMAVSECEFEYGTSASYGKSEPCSSLPGSGTSPVAVSAPFSGGTANTIYHYRVVAKNAAGTGYSPDETFTTLLNSSSGTSENKKQPAKAEDGPVSAKASEGTGTVTVGQYGSDPGGVRLFGSPGKYVDVYVGTKSSFSKVEYEDCELGATKTLYWFNPQAAGGRGHWEEVTRQTYLAGSPDCIEAVAEASGTSPTISQMTGTRYGGTGTVEPPEFGKCVAAPVNGAGKVDGFFSKSNCSGEKSEITEGPEAGEGKGKYEWDLDVLEDVHFTSTSGSVKLETADKSSKVACAGESGDGEYTGPKSIGDLVLTFTGCTQGAAKCASSGSGAGEIKTTALEGELGWVAKPAKVGLALEPKSGAFTEFSCGSANITVRGRVIAPVKAGKASTTPVLKFKASKGAQSAKAFEDAPEAILEESSSAVNGGAYAALGLSTSITLGNEGATPVEINAEY